MISPSTLTRSFAKDGPTGPKDGVIFVDIRLAGRSVGSGEGIGDGPIGIQGAPCREIAWLRGVPDPQRTISTCCVVGEVDSAEAIEEIIGNHASAIFVAEISASLRINLYANLDGVGEILLLQEVAVQIQGNVSSRTRRVHGNCVGHAVGRSSARAGKRRGRREDVGIHN